MDQGIIKGESYVIPRLVAVSGPLRGWTIYLYEETRIGRHPHNSLTIQERQVSGQHCSIRQESGQFRLKDLNSYNGTFVNGHEVKERLLREGDLIQVGNSQFFFWLQRAEELLGYKIPEATQGMTARQQNLASSQNITAQF
jgi:pSer/pThr/pTyr-binding forkhead associated (FHA) protein